MGERKGAVPLGLLTRPSALQSRKESQVEDDEKSQERQRKANLDEKEQPATPEPSGGATGEVLINGQKQIPDGAHAPLGVDGVAQTPTPPSRTEEELREQEDTTGQGIDEKNPEV